jgi:hypothetical protein
MTTPVLGPEMLEQLARYASWPRWRRWLWRHNLLR